MSGLTVQVVMTLVMAAALVLVLVLGRPAAIERRGRNAWVGIRLSSTMASESTWAAAHRAAWPATRLGCGVGAVLVLTSAALALRGADGLSAVVMGAGLVFTLVLVLAGARAADRAARQASTASAEPDGDPR